MNRDSEHRAAVSEAQPRGIRAGRIVKTVCGAAVSRAAGALACLMLLTSCASAPSTPVTSIDPLVGKWSGTVTTGRGYEEFFYLTVNADASIVAQWGLNWSWGTITVANGRASYQMKPPPLEGNIRFYQSNGRPTMYMEDLFATFYAYVTKE